MTLKFALFENNLTSDPDDYSAVVQDLQSKTQEDVIDLMISRGSTVTKAEALSVNEEYTIALVQLLKDGYSINTPIFNLSPSIKGVFHGADESFNKASHSVKINVTPGARIREIGSEITVERVKGASPQPDIEYLDDLGSGRATKSLPPETLPRCVEVG
ncbi:MAG TPA: DNA-binding domain-containing protein [Prolixibacteraceae bacterium]|nr:DNA-binding domain-containing protein [Prolixibacteraceae bacterium]